MKAKKVNENINFQRHVEPKDALGLGGPAAQKAALDDLGEKLRESGIGSTFHAGQYIADNPKSPIGMTVQVPTNQPNKLYWTVYREKADNGTWSYVVYYNVNDKWNTNSTIKFESMKKNEVLDYLLMESEKGYVAKINNIGKTINTLQKKQEGFEKKLEQIRKHNES